MKIEKVGVLIPAHNEEKNIGRVTKTVRELGFFVLVVDDGSTDQTAVVARANGAEVIGHAPNRGKGYALRKGLDWFLAQVQYDAVVMMDSDSQHDPLELRKFLEALSDPNADLVIGNRMSDPIGMPWLRRITNRTMSFLISACSGAHVPDTQCGYRAIKIKALQKLELKTDRFEIESEMLLEAGRAKTRMVSIPIRSVYEGGASHVRPWQDTVRFISFLFLYFLRAR